MIEHDARVRAIGIYERKVKRYRGRGIHRYAYTDTVKGHTDVQAYCACGWEGPLVKQNAEATADAAGHAQSAAMAVIDWDAVRLEAARYRAALAAAEGNGE